MHVPYKEVFQLFANVGAGEVQLSFASIPSSQGIYRAGKLRYLAVATPARATDAECAHLCRSRWPGGL